jgi:HlyD family secretion protein
VLIAIDNAQGDLLPNTNVRVTVTVANDRNVLTIPREALHFEQGKPYVYKVVDGVLRRTPVERGEGNLTQMQILNGLKEGDVVALGTTNGQSLGSGLPVNVVR